MSVRFSDAQIIFLEMVKMLNDTSEYGKILVIKLREYPFVYYFEESSLPYIQ